MSSPPPFVRQESGVQCSTDDKIDWKCVAHHMSSFIGVLLLIGTAPERHPLPPADHFTLSVNINILRHRDKLGFFIGVVDMGLSIFFVGKFPQYFYLWHTFRAVLLFVIRGARYYTIDYHSFLLDFCYYANAILVYWLFFDRENHSLFEALWGFAFGNLIAAVGAFNNALIFHKLDKLTSVLFHLSPSLVLWSLRWYGPVHPDGVPLFAICPTGIPIHSERCTLSLGSTMFNAAAVHLAWAVFFYVYVFVIRGNLVENFAMLIQQEGSLVHRFCAPFRHHLAQKAAYMALHFSLSVLFVIPAALAFDYFYLSCLYIFSMMLLSVWNAAGFYLQYMPLRYETNLVNKAKILSSRHRD